MQKSIIPIKGMHCRSCEILIKERLEEIPGINNVQVFYKKKEAQFYSKNVLDKSMIEKAVNEAGYEVGIDDSKDWLSKNPKLYRELGFSLILLVIIYFLAKSLGIFNISVGVGSNPGSLGVVLLIGLTAGVSTCMALVGGLVLGISSRHAEKHPESTAVERFRPHIYFNLGRILSYALLGGMIGLIGKAFQVSGSLLGVLIVLVGLVMLVLGLQLTELFPKISNGGITLPSGISRILGLGNRENMEYSHANSMLIGALTFFLPCGFTQAMQLYAMTTGSFLSGALIMGIFAIGTAPGLLGIGGLTSVLQGLWARRFFRFAGLVVISLAIFNISNGYNLTGFRLALSSPKDTMSQAQDPNVKLVNGVQEVYMTQTAGGYKPNKFTIKNNLPVKWTIESKDSRSCSASISMTSYGIRQILKQGTNIIEFTPNKIGEISFSCSMGMYTGKFNVVEGGADTIENPAGNTQSPTTESSKSDSSPSPIGFSPNNSSDLQIIKTTFSSPDQDITPTNFTVNVGKPVRFEIEVLADGEGCMGSIGIPGLTKTAEIFEKGKTITFDFTPTKIGKYEITCAMGVPRGALNVV